jgi:hypothetical protein
VGTSLLQLLDDATRSNLQDLRNAFFDWLLISTVLVILGVVCEEADVILMFKWARRCLPIGILLPTHRLDRWAKRVSTIGWIVLLVGVSGEGIFEGLVSRADGWLQDFSNIQLAAAQRQADLANERASVNGRESAKLREDTERLKGNNLILETQVLKLREKLGDRHLTPDEQHDIGLSLLQFKGKKLSFIVLNSNEEPMGIAHDIFNAMALTGNKDSAQWDCSFFIAPINADPIRGIRVEISAGRSGKSDRFAVSRFITELRKHLDIDGPLPVREFPSEYPAVSSGVRGSGNIDADAHIRIIIGKK